MTRSELTSGNRLISRIHDRSASLAIWGGGYIGLSAALAFAQAGFRCTVVDIKTELVRALNNGTIPPQQMVEGVQIDLAQLIRAGRFKASGGLSGTELSAIDVHLVCVPTERDDRPYDEALLSVLDQLSVLLSSSGEHIVSVESTIAPAWLEGHPLTQPLAGPPRLHIAMAPRRDWFPAEGRDLWTLPRVVGTVRGESQSVVQAFYATVSNQVLMASDWRHAALVKVVENSLRYIDIVLTNQLATAFPDMDVAEIMRLAASKWNVQEYHPSFGIGGYCVPLAPLYLMEQTKSGSHLSALREAVNWDDGYADIVAGQIASKRPEAVGILGASYAPDTNIYHRSPALRLGRRLSERGVNVAVHDPFVSQEEAEETFGLPWLDYPHHLDRFSLLLVGASHAAYRELPAILSRLDSPPAVVDNLGGMRECFAGLSVPYSEMGAPGAFPSQHAQLPGMLPGAISPAGEQSASHLPQQL